MRYVAASVVTNTQIHTLTLIHTHTYTQNNYSNPHACAKGYMKISTIRKFPAYGTITYSI